MRRLDILAYFLGQFWKKFPNDIVRCESVHVVRFEVFLANDPVLVDVEKSGAGHPLGHALCFGVEDAEASNDPGIGVGQQRKVDTVPGGEVLQDGLAVVADCRQLDPVLFESLSGILQLHELRLAKGSPVGRAEKQKDGSVRSLQALIRLLMPTLIGQQK